MGHLDDIDDLLSENNNNQDQNQNHNRKSSSKGSISIEDIIVDNINSISNIFDYLYFFKSLGVIGEDNILYRNLNKGNWGSKFWALSLLLSIKKSFSKCWKLFNYKLKLKFYIQNFNSIKTRGENQSVNHLILNKLKLKLDKINSLLYDQLFELIQNLIYFLISVLDLFKNFNLFNISKHKWAKFKDQLETVSNLITILRFSMNGYNVVKILQ